MGTETGWGGKEQTTQEAGGGGGGAEIGGGDASVVDYGRTVRGVSARTAGEGSGLKSAGGWA